MQPSMSFLYVAEPKRSFSAASCVCDNVVIPFDAQLSAVEVGLPWARLQSIRVPHVEITLRQYSTRQEMAIVPPAILRSDTSRALTVAPGSTKLSSRSGAASARTPRPAELAENRENAATRCCLEARSRGGLVLGPSCWDAARDTLRVGAAGEPVRVSLRAMHERSRSVCEGEASVYHVLALWESGHIC